jgi:hypothetical protein
VGHSGCAHSLLMFACAKVRSSLVILCKGEGCVNLRPVPWLSLVHNIRVMALRESGYNFGWGEPAFCGGLKLYVITDVCLRMSYVTPGV